MDKLLAFVFMAIDHAGAILFPDYTVLRLIGRIAMPIYAFGVAKGYYFSTLHGTIKKYKRNLLLLAIVSQIPFMLMAGAKLNICVSWLLAIYLMDFIINKKYSYLWALVLIFTTLQSVIPTDYGMLGLLLPIGFFLFDNGSFQKKKDISLLIYPYTMILVFFYSLIDIGNLKSIQYYCILFVPILNLALSKRFEKIIIPKWLNYSFYPLSMIPFLAIKYL